MTNESIGLLENLGTNSASLWDTPISMSVCTGLLVLSSFVFQFCCSKWQQLGGIGRRFSHAASSYKSVKELLSPSFLLIQTQVH